VAMALLAWAVIKCPSPTRHLIGAACVLGMGQLAILLLIAVSILSLYSFVRLPATLIPSPCISLLTFLLCVMRFPAGDLTGWVLRCALERFPKHLI